MYLFDLSRTVPKEAATGPVSICLTMNGTIEAMTGPITVWYTMNGAIEAVSGPVTVNYCI